MVGVALTLVLAGAAAACSGSETADDATPSPGVSGSASESADTSPVTVVDAAGQSHTFDKPVTRIGCNWVGCMEVLADLGVRVRASETDQIEGSKLFFPVGEPEFDLDKLGGAENPESWAQTDIELIGDRGPEDPALKALAEVADMFYLYAPGFDTDAKYTGTDAYEENLRLMGKVTGRSAQAEEVITRFQDFVTALKAKAPAGAADITVSPLLATNDGTYITQPASSAFCVALEQNALGRCATSAKFDASTWEINPEAYLAMNPDWIAYTGSVGYADADATSKTTWKARHDPVWDKLAAVQQGHVYDTADQMHCCGLRTLEYHLRDYAFHVWGPASGVPDPGILIDFDPTTAAKLSTP
jgi:ABC-type Fe3+-hydroxamate transport system substrate-binding protein